MNSYFAWSAIMDSAVTFSKAMKVTSIRARRRRFEGSLALSKTDKVMAIMCYNLVDLGWDVFMSSVTTGNGEAAKSETARAPRFA
jgi:hypothetical protein